MDRVRKNSAFLVAIATARRDKNGKLLIRSAKPSQLDALCEVVVNILHGVIPISDIVKKTAAKHKNIIRKLAKKCLLKLARKKLFLKYFGLIRRLIAAALPVIGLTLQFI